MFQHSPKQIAVNLGSGALPAATLASITIGQNVPPGALIAVIIQGAQTAAAAVTTTVLGKGDEISLGPAGPFSYDAATAAYIRWVVFRTPSGYVPGNQILLTASSTWPATTYATVVWLQNSSQYLGYGGQAFAAAANTAFGFTVNLGSGTIISNAYRQSTLELCFSTNAAAQAWNGLGNNLATPDAGSWSSFINGAGTGLGVINLWAAYSQRPPVASSIIGRYAVAVNTYHVFIRFGGG